MSNIPQPHKYAYFVVNDSDDLEALQECLIPYGGVEAMDDVIVDYALDKRRIKELIQICREGCIIFTPYLARLGKSLKELYSIVQLANEKNIDIVFCDRPTYTFSNKYPSGDIYTSMLQWAVELQENIKSDNTKSGLSKKKDEIARLGRTRNKAGDIITRLGRHKGYKGDNSAAVKANINNAIVWRKESKAVKFALRKRAEGWGVMQIAVELGKLYDDAPDIYCTPKGAKPTKGTVSKWLKEAKENKLQT